MRLVKAVLFIAALIPAARIIHALISDPGLLGSNPAEAIQHMTGDWCLNFLALTLAITPVRRLSGINRLIRLRRMLGLFAFFYGVAHFMSYLAFDKLFDMVAVMRDIGKRPFILLGALALIVMTPLAITSTDSWVRRLGGHIWARLHRTVYIIPGLGVAHYWLMVKSDIAWPAFYAVLFAVLLVMRLRLFHPAKSKRHEAVVERNTPSP